ncbi:sensor domain-containing diguanylate cyclase [Noviherbaspirillum denitrificans]|uniref:diguanylate cyclase n=1 Tax=Noviherbaspirillum denitrificans TaxID=1968433 RepID=A0A254TJA2_9BURK|nr:sensor domain-containing diguanylate cyclase [Noviherbaspirillum denitrificans]OWW19788.1 diguanylate cyclase [Noviherbaspirillum denitrificans]
MSHDLARENRQLRDQLKQLIANAQKNQQILQRHQRLDLQLISADSFQALFDTLFSTFPETAGLDIVTLGLIDGQYDIRRILVQLEVNLSELPQLIFLQDESEYGDLSGQLHKPMLGAYSEERFGMMFPEPLAPPASAAIVPLRRHTRLIGTLNLGSNDPERFMPNMSTDFIEHMASIAAICVENVINNERLKHIGLTDPLTGVNNRRYLERRLLEEIGRSRRQQTPLSCMYMDIDHFKQINDRIGHQAGDEVLRGVAGRIKAELRLSDSLGRFGGEEFVVLLTDTEREDAVNVAERIRQSIAEQPLVLASGEALNVTISVGVAGLLPAMADEAVETTSQHLVARADHALYEAKALGRNRVVVES